MEVNENAPIPSTEKVPLPPLVQVTKSPGELIISHRLFRPVNLILLVICLGWDALILYNIFSTVFSTRQSPVTACTITAGLIGLILTYVALVGTVNRVVVRVDHNELVVQHRPIPFQKGLYLLLSDFDHLYYDKLLRKQARGSVVLHDLSVYTHEKKRLFVIDSESADLPLFVKQEIEAWLAENHPIQLKMGDGEPK
jgi:hypothetical protein